MMKTVDVLFSLSDYSKKFIKNYKNPLLDQEIIDKIIVDFINYFGFMFNLDFAMITSDLREEEKKKEERPGLQKEQILPALKCFQKKFKVEISYKNVNADVVDTVIEAFIKGYMAA